jgi:hypothetical protein
MKNKHKYLATFLIATALGFGCSRNQETVTDDNPEVEEVEFEYANPNIRKDTSTVETGSAIVKEKKSAGDEEETALDKKRKRYQHAPSEPINSPDNAK